MDARSPGAVGKLLAIGAAALFGASTPLVQRAGAGVEPWATAAILYLGSALVALRVRPRGAEAGLRKGHLPRLLMVSAAGAVLAPASLAWGLQHTNAADAALLLNTEAIFTVVLAWLVHREPMGRRLLVAVACMVAGGAVLVAHDVRFALGGGALAVLAATFGWAFDNTFTRPLSALDPRAVVGAKGLLGATLSALVGATTGEHLPSTGRCVALLACGAVGYGWSLRLYLGAQRRIGAARTGSIFAVAPFAGAGAAWLLGQGSLGLASALAALLFAVGLVLQFSEESVPSGA